jgi:hypothetical protein
MWGSLIEQGYEFQELEEDREIRELNCASLKGIGELHFGGIFANSCKPQPSSLSAGLA